MTTSTPPIATGLKASELTTPGWYWMRSLVHKHAKWEPVRYWLSVHTQEPLLAGYDPKWWDDKAEFAGPIPEPVEAAPASALRARP